MKLNEHNYIQMYRYVDFNINDNIAFDDIEKHLKLFQKSMLVDVGPNKFLDERTINGTIRVLETTISRPFNFFAQAINYISIRQNNDENEKPHTYYFVTGFKYISEGTIEFTLTMDTLNTYQKFVTDSNYWSTRTLTCRQHKDRFNENLYPIFDKFDEGLGSLPMYKVKGEKILQNDEDLKWYLVYHSTGDDENSPIKCDAYTNKEKEITIAYVPFNAALHGYGQTGIYYWNTYIHANGQARACYINGEIKTVHFICINFKTNKIYYDDDSSYYDFVMVDGGLRTAWIHPKVTTYDADKYTCLGCPIKFLGGIPTQIVGVGKYAFAPTMQVTTPDITVYDDGSDVAIYGDIYSTRNDGTRDISWTVTSIELIDRTDSKLNKIVECPYCPFEYLNGALDNINIDFTSIKEARGSLPITAYDTQSHRSTITSSERLVTTSLPGSRTQSDFKSSEYETKLLTSQFHKYKFTYDSFTKEIKPELFNEPNTYVQIFYYQSLDMSSKLMFNFSMNYAEDDDYAKYLVCGRNNELPIYSSSYLNYIRNGYNFDIKAQSMQTAKNVMSIGSSVISTVGSAAMTVASGGTLGAVSTIQQLVGLTTNVSNVVMSQISNENAIQQKKDEALASTVGVSNVDDLSLLNVYSGNKLYKYEYSIRDGLKNSIYEMFYLTGYACNDYGRPNLKSRSNFNYIKASTTIDTLVTANAECKSDIVNRIANGILIIHKCEDAIGALFNYENWEDHLLSS